MSTIISVKGLTKYYGNLLAVDHVTFNVFEGEIFGFLGPNGAGKTTTIKMLTGLTYPSDGTAIIGGYDLLKEIRLIKGIVGVVPEYSNLYSELSVEENLKFMAHLYHVRGERLNQRVDQLLKLFRLQDYRNISFGKLSRGLKRRVTLAAALVHNPKILFLDEPTTGLDVISARNLRRLLEDLRGQGITIFLTTHYIEEAEQLCDRVAIIVKGRLVALDTVESLRKVVGDAQILEVMFKSRVDKAKLTEYFNGEIASFHGDRVRIICKDFGEVVEKLLKFSKTFNFEISSINTVKPTLEDAFVKLTGIESSWMLLEKGVK